MKSLTILRMILRFTYIEDVSLKISVQVNIFHSCSQTNCDLWDASDKPVKLRKSVVSSD